MFAVLFRSEELLFLPPYLSLRINCRRECKAPIKFALNRTVVLKKGGQLISHAEELANPNHIIIYRSNCSVEFYVAKMDVSLIRCHSLSFYYSIHYISTPKEPKQTHQNYTRSHTRTLVRWLHRRYGSTPTPISIRPIDQTTHAAVSSDRREGHTRTQQVGAAASLRSASDDIEAHLGGVGGLHLVVDPVQQPPQALLRRRVQDLGSDPRRRR